MKRLVTLCHTMDQMGKMRYTSQLHMAVKNRDESIFGHLVGNRDVELNLVNGVGYTPLDLASKIKIEKAFLVADILAFYCSVAATFSLAEYGDRDDVDPLVRGEAKRLCHRGRLR